MPPATTLPAPAGFDVLLFLAAGLYGVWLLADLISPRVANAALGLGVTVAEIVSEFPERGAWFVPLGAATPDGAVRFEALQPGAALIVMDRRNPSVPLVLLLSALAVLGAMLTAGDRLARARAARRAALPAAGVALS